VGLLTKKSKRVADYHTWGASELTNGDILDVYWSLGGRAADSVTIESLDGPSTIRFNVVQKIYKEHGALHNPVFKDVGVLRKAPVLVGEIELAKDDIIIEQDSTHTWLRGPEIPISDIKIVTKSTGLKITVT
jgi:hypothetical protein